MHAIAQAVQQAATAVGTAQKTIQSGGAEAPTAAVASGGQQQQQGQQQYASPAPPTININVPGLGGNAQGPPGLTYTQGSQGNGAASQGYQGAQQGYQGSTAQGYSQGNGQVWSFSNHLVLMAPGCACSGQLRLPAVQASC